MLIILYLLLMVRVGHDVTLTCARSTSWLSTQLFWIGLVSGDIPEVLGGTFTFDYDRVNKTSRITAKQGYRTFLLHISKTKRSDTGFYYCMKVTQLNMTFLTGVFLEIKGPESDVTAIIEDFPSDPVRPGDSVTLQCSVLSDFEKKTCPGDHSVYWFRAGSDESHPSVIYTHGNRGGECEKSPEAHSLQKCVYSFSKTISSFDAGTYYCAVATCGEILFGNGRKLEIEVTSMWSQEANAVIFLLCAVLAISLIVTSFLTYAIKTNKCDCCNAVVALQKNSGGQKSQQRDEDTRVYSAVVFVMLKTDCGAIKDAKAAEREKIYAAVKAFGLDK